MIQPTASPRSSQKYAWHGAKKQAGSRATTITVKKNNTLLVNRDLRATSRWAKSALGGASGIAVSAFQRHIRLLLFLGSGSIISEGDQRASDEARLDVTVCAIA